ncbi:MAG: hypothetical protein VW080_01345 [Flavobacteriaceae bacterium]
MKSKAIFFFGLVLACINLFSQPSAVKTIKGSLNANSGTIQYEATVEISANLSNVGKDNIEITLCRKVISFEIHAYEYNGTSAADLGFSFPLSKPYKQKVTVNVDFYKGKNSYPIGATIDGCGGFGYYLGSPKALLNYFDIQHGGGIASIQEGYTTQFNALSLRINSAQLTSDLYVDELNEMQNAIRKKMDLDKQIQKLQYEVTNTNEETKANLQKKKRIYIKLSEIDQGNDYSRELEEIERKLIDVAWDELEKEEDSPFGIVIESTKNNETKEERENREEYEEIKKQVSKVKDDFDREVEYMMLMTNEANRLYNQVQNMSLDSFDRVELLRKIKNNYLNYLTPAQQNYIVNAQRGAFTGAVVANAASHDWGYGDRYFGMTINTGGNIIGGEISKFSIPLITYIEVNLPISESFLIEFLGEYSLNWVLKPGDSSTILGALGEDTGTNSFYDAPSIFDEPESIEIEKNKYGRYFYGLGFNFGWSRAVSLQLLSYNTKFYHHFSVDGETKEKIGEDKFYSTYGLGFTVDPWNGKERNGLSRFSFSYTLADKNVKFINADFEWEEVSNLNFRFDGAAGAFYYGVEYNMFSNKQVDFSLSTIGIKLGFYIGG